MVKEHNIVCIGMVADGRTLAEWVVYECNASPCKVQASCNADILLFKVNIVDQTTNSCVLNWIHGNSDCL